MPKAITAYKGFNLDMTCRGFQYEVGKTYEHTGDVEICFAGFHACEHPLDCFSYYAPGQSRYAEVSLEGATATHGDDTKIAAAKITVTAELELHQVIERAVKWVFDRAKPVKGSTAKADRTSASATGDWGAASATGLRGAASATGYQGAASATGDQGAAMASGYQGKAQGKDGSALFLVERNDDYEIINTWSGIVGKKRIKADTWYTLKNGKPVEVKS